ncbi:MAG: hypothetical protein ACR2KK_07150 [Acidimicrobiales bacterium]
MTTLTAYLDIPLSELAARALAGDTALSVDQFDVVVGEQVLRVEATGTRAGLLEAAEALHDLAAWAAEHDGHRAAHRWEMLGEHLTDRASRADPIGVEALLRGDNGKPQRLLELLAAAPGGSMPRAQLGGPLAASESHVSHILRSLHDAGLIHRHQEGRSVTVTLSARGREVVGASPASRSAADLSVLIDGLPPARRRQVQNRPTMAPVFALPA